MVPSSKYIVYLQQLLSIQENYFLYWQKETYLSDIICLIYFLPGLMNAVEHVPLIQYQQPAIERKLSSEVAKTHQHLLVTQ
jgi:hypothetical protein